MFKINYLIDKNTINKIVVFYGLHLDVEDPNQLFATDPLNPAFKNVFNQKELNEISEKGIEVVFLKESIYIDDNIGVIKLKIIQAFGKTFSEEEIYLYCLKKEELNPIAIYQSLTLNDKIQLTRIRIDQLLLNIRDEDGLIVEFQDKKDKYTFDDILKLNFSDQHFLLTKILGQKIVIGSNEYPFIADPFYITEYDTLLERSRKEMTTLNNALLLDSGIIYDNNIYLCLAENVFQYCEKNNLSSEYTSKIYYPFLYRLNINNLQDLDNNKRKLIDQSIYKIDKSMPYFENINMFYDVYKLKEPTNVFSLNEKYCGIKNIKVTIHPEYKVKIPIDIIFKLIHSSKDFPLLKYNPTTRQENIYRLYAPKLTVDGRKIPYLPKANIFKLTKNIGKTKSVSVFTTIKYQNQEYNFICEFEENGSISIYSYHDFDNVIQINDHFDTINHIISESVNPLIDQIRPFFEQSGYKMNHFHAITDNNIEIRDLKFQTLYNITKAIKIENIRGCISNIFNIESYKSGKEIEMRYKRVSNFNKHDSLEAFIIEQQKKGLPNDEIVEEIIKNYEDMNEDKAYEMIDKLINELQVTRGANKRRAIEIKINPGFKTIFSLNPIISELTIIMDSINDLSYLHTIPVYLDTMIRITQDINSTRYSVQNIQQLCSGKEIQDIHFHDLTSVSEEAFPSNELPVIENDNINYPETYEDAEHMNDLLDILGYSMEGGSKENENDSSSSSASVSSEDFSKSSSIASDIQGSIGSFDSSSSSSSSDEMYIIPKIPSLESNQISLISPSVKIPVPLLETQERSEPVAIESESVKPISIESESESVKPVVIETESVKPISIESQSETKPVLIELEPEVKKPLTKVGNEKLKQVKENLENTVKNIEGLKLNNPYLFQERLEQRDPNLFLTLREGKFDGYSRMCPSSVRRQPVILTKEELEENKEVLQGEFKDGEYQGPDVLKYGSSPDDQFYYMCPRYWCLKTNKAITEKQIQEGECGGIDAIIPKNAKKVPKGKYIYQFYDNKTTHYPGFHKENTPTGLCVPCCYDSWNKPAQIGRRQKCKNELKNEKEELEKKEPDNYIKGPEKYPLPNNRWGYLPFSIQKFFHELNVDCQISKSNTNIKPFHTCLLRHGVENNEKQSFIACIANALFYADKDPKTNKNFQVPTIDAMKDLIIQAINIDKFITYQNGDLVSSFSDDSLEVNESNYHDSILYSKIIKVQDNDYKNEQLQFFKKVVQSYENFLRFLKDNTITIDYTYLWDIICKPNPLLFDSGINLIILEVMDNDITNNIEFICPTNHYSVHNYDTRKRCIILIKHDNYFEPVYSYRNEETKISIVKTFNELDPNLSKSLRAVFKKIIKPIMKDKCSALTSRNGVYKFQRPPLLDNLILDLTKKNYTVLYQILNFQGKVIGVNAKDVDGQTGFIPCFPSSLTKLKKPTCEQNCHYDYVLMSENVWNNYDDTLAFLKKYYEYQEPLTSNNESGKCIDGTDLCKVVEDKMVVGFLTKTNQFVQISIPIPESEIRDNIRKVTNGNFLVADIETQPNTNVDRKRVDYIKRIELETAFYNVFRNTIRILLNDYVNSSKRKQIQEESNNKFVLYDLQLEKIIILLKELCDGYILFLSKQEGFDYHVVKDINTCISLPKDKCNNICMFTNDKCAIILPKENLLTETNNEIYYYGKMADELIRYNRIKSFIFQPQTYLSFGQTKYNLKDDEIIILQSLLNQEYFENLTPSEINKYAKHNTFDSTQPIISESYDNQIILEDQVNHEYIRDCFPNQLEKISLKKWQTCFPSDYKEIEYKETKLCSWFLLIDIIKQFNGQNTNIDYLKDILFEEYKKYSQQFERSKTHKIADILIEQGMLDEGTQIKMETLNLLELIMSEGYILTNFDLWILLVKFKIPSFFISDSKIRETKNTEFQFCCFTNTDQQTQEYVFIVIPSIKENSSLVYKIISNNDNSIKIPLDVLNADCKEKFVKSIQKWVSIEKYMETFERNLKTAPAIVKEKKVTKPRKVKPTLVITENVDEEKEKEKEEEVLIIEPVKKNKKTKKVTPDEGKVKRQTKKVKL